MQLAVYNPMRVNSIAYTLAIRKEGRCLNDCSGHGNCTEDGACECTVRGGGHMWLGPGGRRAGVSGQRGGEDGITCHPCAQCLSWWHDKYEELSTHASQAEWAGGDCSVSPAAACLVGSRRAAPRPDQHGTCWQECSCSSPAASQHRAHGATPC